MNRREVALALGEAFAIIVGVFVSSAVLLGFLPRMAASLPFSLSAEGWANLGMVVTLAVVATIHVHQYLQDKRSAIQKDAKETPRISLLRISPMGIATAALAVLIIGWLGMEVRSLHRDLVQVHSEQQELVLTVRSLKARGGELESNLEEQQGITALFQSQLVEREERIVALEHQVDEMREPLAMAVEAAPRAVVASMVLSSVRAETPTLELPDTAAFVELYVNLEGDDDYASFRVTLTTAAGAHLWASAGTADHWTGTGLSIRESEWGDELVVKLQARLLAEGSYTLALEGRDATGTIHALDSYRFSVIRS
jgi:hypothetical protein